MMSGAFANLAGRPKLYDLTMALPLVGFYAWTAWQIVWTLPSLKGPGLVHGVLGLAFVTLLIALLLIRRPPVGKLRGLAPRLTAAAGAFAGLLFFHLPPAALSEGALLLSIGLMSAGMAGAVFSLAHLGRQISIMPEARRLITTGPYAWVRHPLYLFEQIALLGIAIQYQQPAAAVLFLSHLTLQLCRTVYEERVLEMTFTEYRDYASRTPRLIPVPRLRSPKVVQ